MKVDHFDVHQGSFEVNEGLYYAKEHSWIRIAGETCKVGVTDYFQKMMRGWSFRGHSALLFVALPKTSSKFSKSEPVASIESSKAVADLCAPLSGEILNVNENLSDNPGLIGESPYEDGWIVTMKPSRLGDEMESLMTAVEYCSYLEEIVEARKRKFEEEYQEMQQKLDLK